MTPTQPKAPSVSEISVKWTRIRAGGLLPTGPARVLVVYESLAKREILFARYSGGQFRLIDDKGKTRKPEYVTHWMLMPTLPMTRKQWAECEAAS